MECASAKPWPYVRLDPLCSSEFPLHLLRRELLQQLDYTHKETDIFKLAQTKDLASLTGADCATSLPQLLRLRDALYSEQFRSLVSHVCQCGPLTDRVDMSGNVYSQGDHLLCHDDVIGTRAVSFILYLTDPDRGPWSDEDGGAFELYDAIPTVSPSSVTGQGRAGADNATDFLSLVQQTPDAGSPVPVGRVFPAFNRLLMFHVQPGVSLHAVQEVYCRDDVRVSIQGWFHAAQPPPDPCGLATLRQLQGRRGQLDTRWAFSPLRPSSGTLTLPSNTDRESTAGLINKAYLDDSALSSVAAAFQDQQSVQLHSFFDPKAFGNAMQAALKSVDGRDGLCANLAPADRAGCTGRWQLCGPVHKQRFLALDLTAPADAKALSDNTNQNSDPSQLLLERHLSRIWNDLLATEQFGSWLRKATGVAAVSGVRGGMARRFRPGLDYTMGLHEWLSDRPILDVSFVLIHGDSDVWSSGEAGGYEVYVNADTDTRPETAEVYATSTATVNRSQCQPSTDDGVPDNTTNDGKDTSGPALVANGSSGAEEDIENITPSANLLTITLRRPGQQRFIKYVNSLAPGSRVDICAEYLFE